MNELEERLARLGPRQRALLDQRLRRERLSGHRLVADTLARLGVSHLYGVAGQPVYETFGACAQAGIRLIGTRHQQAAALMAAGHNYLAGRQSAATMVSTGAPAANALAAAAVASDNCWPLVIIAGAAPLSAANTGYFMALDARQLYQPVTKSALRVSQAGEIPEAIVQAFEVAGSGRPGAVLVELPEDTLTASAFRAEVVPGPDARPRGPEPDPVRMQEVAEVMLTARRPLLVIGKGARWTSSAAALQELVEELSIPFVTSPMGRGMISETHPLCMNAVSRRAQSQADVILLLGARLNWVFRYGQQFAADATLIQVDLDPAEFGRNREVPFGVHADAGNFLRALMAGIGATGRSEARGARDESWMASLCGQRVRTEDGREILAAETAQRISPLRLAAELRNALPDDAITIFDGNLSMAACQQMIPARLPASRLTPGTSGCLGGGIPYAIAAALVHPGRPVVAICGDFSFGLGVMEIETAVRHKVPFVIVVANNDGNSGSLRQTAHLTGTAGERVMMSQPGLRYERIVDALGGYAEYVDRAEDIGPALGRAIASRRTACINVAIDPDAAFPRG